MRRLLIFVFLLGIGLTFLFWMDRRGRRESPEEAGARAGQTANGGPQPPQIDPDAGRVPGPGNRSPVRQAGEGGQQPEAVEGEGQDGPTVQISGGMDFKKFATESEEGFLLYHLSVENVIQRGVRGEIPFTLEGFSVKEYDAETGALMRTVTADRAQAAIQMRGFEPQGLANNGYAEMTGNVVVRQERGTPYAPVELRAERMMGWLDRDEFRTDPEHPVRIEGDGLTAEGFGLHYDGPAGRATIMRGGFARVVTEDRRLARFDAPEGGPLSIIQRSEIGPNVLRLTAGGGARLQVSGEPALEISGDRVTLDAERNAEGDIVLQEAEVEGTAIAVRGTDRYRGESGRATFDIEGNLTSLVLEENPSATVTLMDSEEAPWRVRASGAGPLDVEVTSARGRFQLLGPGRVEVFPPEGRPSDPRAELGFDFTQRVTGGVSEAGDQGDFQAYGNVLFSQGEVDSPDYQWLRSEAIEATLFALEPRAADVVCRGPTLVRALDPDGEHTEIDAEGGLDLVVRGVDWTMPIARGVEGRFLGEDPYTVRAGVIRDLDAAARTFVAENNVGYSSAFGTASGDRAVVLPDGRMTLTGEAGTPAALVLLPSLDGAGELRAGTLTADEFQFTEEWAEASGAVHMVVAQGADLLELRAAYARVESPIPAEGSKVRKLDVIAETITKATFTMEGTRYELGCEALTLSALLVNLGGDPSLRVNHAQALGGVWARTHGELDSELVGEELRLTEEAGMSLVPAADGRVQLNGSLPGEGVSFELDAIRIEASPKRIVAIDPDVWIAIPLLPNAAERLAPGEDPRSHFVAGRLEATAERIWVAGGVEAEGLDARGTRVKLECEELEVLGTFGQQDGEPLPWNERVQDVKVGGDFRMNYGGLGSGRGSRLRATPKGFEMFGQPAVVESQGMALESSRIGVDLERFLPDCDRGALRSTSAEARWSLGFASLKPMQVGEDSMIVIASPLYQELERSAQANFMTAWLRREAWESKGRELLYKEPAPDLPAVVPASRIQDGPQADLVQTAFRKLAAGEVPKYVRAALVEGDVEVAERGRRVARAEAIYSDVDTGVGWMRGAELSYDIEVSGRSQRLRIRTDELRTTLAGSLVAETATLTTCTHDEPHYVIQTGVLELTAREDGRWRFSANKNRIVFRRGIQLPLPNIRNVVLDKSGDFVGIEDESGEVSTLENFSIRDTPRFGTAIGTVLAFEIGRLGEHIARLFAFDTDTVRGRWKFDGAYLSSRGPLASVGLELRQQRKHNVNPNPDEGTEEFWLRTSIRGIPDEGRDRGILRVEDEDRNTFRYWYNLRGRYPFSDDEWIDLVVNSQADAGVQSEFFEDEYQRYEERDTYLHWRKSDDGNYYDAIVQARLDSFRREVEQLPKVGAYAGRQPVAEMFGKQLLYTGSMDLAYLRRRDGDAAFEGEFLSIRGGPDGLGDRETLRADALQRLELPFETDLAGIRAVPFVEGRLTGWSEGEDESDSPLRGGLFGGLELNTSFVRVGSGGYHTIAPLVRYKNELHIERADGLPVRFDQTEDLIDGNTLELGIRSIWNRPATNDRLDLQLLAEQQTERFGSLRTQERVNVLGGFRTEINRLPVGVVHDGRYDPQTGDTIYSRSVLALRPSDALITQFGFVRGLDQQRARLFEAATVQGRYRINPKWEVELTNWIDIAGNQSLRSEVILRRFAHDFLLELSVLHNAGEGGTGIGLNFMPLLTYRPSRLGILDDDPR